MPSRVDYFSFTEGTEVQRRHAVDVSPPHVVAAQNVYPSPADGALTLRPDMGAMVESLQTVNMDADAHTSGLFAHPLYGPTRAMSGTSHPLHAEQYGKYMIMNSPDLKGTPHGPFITKESDPGGGGGGAGWGQTGGGTEFISNGVEPESQHTIRHVIYSSVHSKYLVVSDHGIRHGSSLTTLANCETPRDSWRRLAVKQSGNVIIAVGAEMLARSTDGETFTEVFRPAYPPRGICWDPTNLQFCVVCDGGLIYRSIDDGFTWDLEDSGTTETLTFVFHSPVFDGLIALGTNGTLLTSPDGVTWEQRTITSTNELMTGVDNGVDTIVVGSREGKILTSSDGVDWTQRTVSGTGVVNDLIYTGGYFYFSRFHPLSLYQSSDGITWTTISLTKKLGALHRDCLAYANSNFIFGLSGDKGYKTLAFGGTWDTLAFTTRPTRAVDLQCLTKATNGTILVVGGHQGLLATVDLSTLTTTFHNFPSRARIYKILWLPDGRWLAVGDGGLVATAPAANPSTWTIRNSGVEFTLEDAAVSPGGTIVVVGAFDGVLRAQSFDLYSWTVVNTGWRATRVTFGAGHFLAAGYSPQIRYSSDGVSWSNGASISSGGSYLFCGTSRFFIVGDPFHAYRINPPQFNTLIIIDGVSARFGCVFGSNVLIYGYHLQHGGYGVHQLDSSTNSLRMIAKIQFPLLDRHVIYAGGKLFVGNKAYPLTIPGAGEDPGSLSTQSSPVSEEYVAAAFASVDGYLLLLNVTETGRNYGRRVRWSAPGTWDIFDPNDSEYPGAGVEDYLGDGVFIDARKLGHNVVIWETSGVSVLSQTGFVDAPWEYRRIRDGISLASNPVVVDDRAYFIAKDGMLYVTNGVTVTHTQTPLDISAFSDFTPLEAIWLVYDQGINALCIYQPSETPKLYVVGIDGGRVAHWTLPTLNEGDADVIHPRGIGALPSGVGSSTLYAFYDGKRITRFAYGESITGIDYVRAPLNPNDPPLTRRWWAIITLGQMALRGETEKIRLLSVRPRTYAGSDGLGFDILIQTRETGAAAWQAQGDRHGSARILSSGAVEGNGTVWSYKVADGDDASTVFTLPFLALHGRLYIDSIPLERGSHYDILDDGNGITYSRTVVLSTPLQSGKTLYQYWNNPPLPAIAVNDVFMDEMENFYRISSINNFRDCSVEWGASDERDASHNTARQVDEGEKQLVLPCHGLYDAPQLRFVMLPRPGGTSVGKILGFALEYAPAGRRGY